VLGAVGAVQWAGGGGAEGGRACCGQRVLPVCLLRVQGSPRRSAGCVVGAGWVWADRLALTDMRTDSTGWPGAI
jgi:hypothetical protein